MKKENNNITLKYFVEEFQYVLNYAEENTRETREYIIDNINNFSKNPSKSISISSTNIVDFILRISEYLKDSVLEFVNDPIKFITSLIDNIPQPTDSIDYSSSGIFFKQNLFSRDIPTVEEKRVVIDNVELTEEDLNQPLQVGDEIEIAEAYIEEYHELSDYNGAEVYIPGINALEGNEF